MDSFACVSSFRQFDYCHFYHCTQFIGILQYKSVIFLGIFSIIFTVSIIFCAIPLFSGANLCFFSSRYHCIKVTTNLQTAFAPDTAVPDFVHPVQETNRKHSTQT